MIRQIVAAGALVAQIALPLAGPESLSAQIAGIVTDSTGRHLSGVGVEIWAAAELVAVTVTDSSGRFSYSGTFAAEVRGIVLSRMGYATRAATVAPGDTLARYQLDVLPVPLPEVTVLVARRVCPNREDTRARELWVSAASHYDTTTVHRGLAVRMLRVRESVPGEQVGHVSESRRQPADYRFRAYWWPDAYARHGNVNARIAEHGYALRIDPERPGIPSEDYFGWVYPALEGVHAFHFASAEFGSRHSLSLVGTTPESHILAFCPVDKSQPYIEGTLAIGLDTTMLHASWQITTPRPREHAGGEVVFAPYDAAIGRAHLVPARGSYWRRLGGRQLYYQRSDIFLGWRVSADSTMPELPPTVRDLRQ